MIWLGLICGRVAIPGRPTTFPCEQIPPPILPPHHSGYTRQAGRPPRRDKAKSSAEGWRAHEAENAAATGKAQGVCDRKVDSALTVGKCLSMLAAVMGITRQAGEITRGAWGEAKREHRPEGAFCTTSSSRVRGSGRKGRPSRNQGPVPTLSFHP